MNNQFKFVEDAEIGDFRTTSDGYLVGTARCARTGIQTYLGSELGVTDKAIVRVYRPESEVFAKDSMKSYANKPVTDDHPDELVNETNWNSLAVGSIGEEIMRDGESVRVSLAIMDGAVIEKVKSGKRELSMGYTMDLDMSPGVTKDGDQYDAVMQNLRMNHLAIVKRGRAGSEYRIGDSGSPRIKWGISPLNDAVQQEEVNMTDKLQKVMVDGLSVETTDAGAEAIKKLTNDKQSLEKAIADQKSDFETKIADKDKELATKDGKIADLEKQILDEAAIDARVEAKAKLVDQARKLATDADFTGLKDAEIRKVAVEAVRGKDAMADKSPEYIEAAFDYLVETKDSDAGKDAVKDSKAAKTQANDNGQGVYEKRLQDAWKKEA